MMMMMLLSLLIDACPADGAGVSGVYVGDVDYDGADADADVE